MKKTWNTLLIFGIALCCNVTAVAVPIPNEYLVQEDEPFTAAYHEISDEDYYPDDYIG